MYIVDVIAKYYESDPQASKKIGVMPIKSLDDIKRGKPTIFLPDGKNFEVVFVHKSNSSKGGLI